ncbi:MAG: hypothetical protein WC806_06610 [Candidatus Gracilibacteria bacterium]|jgi:hypothetical protein
MGFWDKVAKLLIVEGTGVCDKKSKKKKENHPKWKWLKNHKGFGMIIFLGIMLIWLWMWQILNIAETNMYHQNQVIMWNDQFQAQMLADGAKELFVYEAKKGADEAGSDFYLEGYSLDESMCDGEKNGTNFGALYESLYNALPENNKAKLKNFKIECKSATKNTDIVYKDNTGGGESISSKNFPLIAALKGFLALNETTSSQANARLVENGDAWYTIPQPNLGDASRNCENIKYTTYDSLKGWYGIKGAEALFDNSPLNHVCNWGKLKFADSYSGKIELPLYWFEKDEITGNIVYKTFKGSDADNFDLKIRVRAPCLPLEIRTPAWLEGETNLDEAKYGNTVDFSTCLGKKGDEIIPSLAPNCKDEFVCTDNDRYTLAVEEAGNFEKDPQVVTWELYGEEINMTQDEWNDTPDAYKLRGAYGSLIPSNKGDNRKDINGSFINPNPERENYRNPSKNSQISNSLLNTKTKENLDPYDDEMKYTVMEIKNPLNDGCTGEANDLLYYNDCMKKKIGVDIYNNEEDNYSYGFIYDFLFNTGKWAKPDGTPMRILSHPTLTLKLVANKINAYLSADPNTTIGVPYLEYQILTNKEIPTPIQHYETTVYYNNSSSTAYQNIQLKRNVIDFAVRN